MMLEKSDGVKERVSLSGEIFFTGNWNYKDSSLKPILNKPLGIITIGDYKAVFTHKDLFSLLEVYHRADLFSIEMINDPLIDTGLVTMPEKKFIDKLKEWIKNVENTKE